jgi:hypothetical protein
VIAALAMKDVALLDYHVHYGYIFHGKCGDTALAIPGE